MNIYNFAGYFLLSISLISVTTEQVYAKNKIDPELQESRKCSSLFAHFENQYNLPANSLHAISLHETGKKHSKYNITLVWPWTVMNNLSKKSYHFPSRKAAIIYVRNQFARGNNNLDVGCMQINLKHHPEAFDSLNEAFSPKQNVHYGAWFLSNNLQKLGSIDKAIGRYHSATKHLAANYHQHVSKIKQSMNTYHATLQQIISFAAYQNKKHKSKNHKYASLYKTND